MKLLLTQKKNHLEAWLYYSSIISNHKLKLNRNKLVGFQKTNYQKNKRLSTVFSSGSSSSEQLRHNVKSLHAINHYLKK